MESNESEPKKTEEQPSLESGKIEFDIHAPDLLGAIGISHEKFREFGTASALILKDVGCGKMNIPEAVKLYMDMPPRCLAVALCGLIRGTCDAANARAEQMAMLDGLMGGRLSGMLGRFMGDQQQQDRRNDDDPKLW
jgi:hypothetical protein